MKKLTKNIHTMQEDFMQKHLTIIFFVLYYQYNIKEDVMTINEQIIELVSKIAGKDTHPVSTIKPSDSVETILDYDDISYAELILAVEKKFGIEIEVFMEDVKTIDDLCIIVTSLLSEKAKQPKEKIVSDPKNFAKRKILQEISKIIVDADLSTEENPTFDTPLEQDFQFIDFAVYGAIEKQYDITIENIDHLRTVGDLCDYIMRKRLIKFQKYKTVCNNPVNFKASEGSYLSPYFFAGATQQKKPSLLERIKQRFAQLVK